MANPKAYSTINTVLSTATTSTGSFTQLCKIKSYPDLGGAPEQIETTDLEDTMQTFVEGIQSMDSMEFTANYNPTDYAAVVNAIPAAGSVLYYQLAFGTNGAQGKFKWSGTHSVRVTGGDVNAVREMVITCTPASKIAPSGISGISG